MPRKMSGMAMSTMEPSIVAMSTPSVVFDSATHLYRSERSCALPFNVACGNVGWPTSVRWLPSGATWVSVEVCGRVLTRGFYRAVDVNVNYGPVELPEARIVVDWCVSDEPPFGCPS